MAAPQASSRLELLQARFQQKQLQEKEQKLLQLYDQQQQRAYQVVQRGSAGSNGSNHATSISQHTVTKTSSSSHTTSTSQGGKVRQMFDERRQTTVKGIDRSYPLEPLENKPRKQANGNGAQKNGNLTVNRQSVTVKRVARADVNSNVNGGKPVVSYHEEVTRESFGPPARHHVEDEFGNENHVARYANGNHRDETHIEEVLDDDTIERNRMMAKLHLMEYDETLKHRVKNDLESEEFPEDFMVDVLDKLPKQSVTKKLSQAEARLERFKNANAKRGNVVTKNAAPKKRSDPIFPAKSASSQDRVAKTRTRELSDRRSRRGEKIRGSSGPRAATVSETAEEAILRERERNASRTDDASRVFCEESEKSATTRVVDSKARTFSNESLKRRTRSESPKLSREVSEKSVATREVGPKSARKLSPELVTDKLGRNDSPRFFCEVSEKSATTYAIDSRSARKLSSEVSKEVKRRSPRSFSDETRKATVKRTIDSKAAQRLIREDSKHVKDFKRRSESPKFFCEESEKSGTTYAIDSKFADRPTREDSKTVQDAKRRSESPRFFNEESRKSGTIYAIDSKIADKSIQEVSKTVKDAKRRSESPRFFGEESRKSGTAYAIDSKFTDKSIQEVSKTVKDAKRRSASPKYAMDSKTSQRLTREDSKRIKDPERRSGSPKFFCEESEKSGATYAIDTKFADKQTREVSKTVKDAKRRSESPKFFCEESRKSGTTYAIDSNITDKSTREVSKAVKDAKRRSESPKYAIDSKPTRRLTREDSKDIKHLTHRNDGPKFSRKESEKSATYATHSTSYSTSPDYTKNTASSILKTEPRNRKTITDHALKDSTNDTVDRRIETLESSSPENQEYHVPGFTKPETRGDSKATLSESTNVFERLTRERSSSPRFLCREDKKSATTMSFDSRGPSKSPLSFPQKGTKQRSESPKAPSQKHQAPSVPTTNSKSPDFARSFRKCNTSPQFFPSYSADRSATIMMVTPETIAKSKTESLDSRRRTPPPRVSKPSKAAAKPRKAPITESKEANSRDFIRSSVSRFFSEQCERALRNVDARNHVRSGTIDRKHHPSRGSSPLSPTDARTPSPTDGSRFYHERDSKTDRSSIDGVSSRESSPRSRKMAASREGTPEFFRFKGDDSTKPVNPKPKPSKGIGKKPVKGARSIKQKTSAKSRSPMNDVKTRLPKSPDAQSAAKSTVVSGRRGSGNVLRSTKLIRDAMRRQNASNQVDHASETAAKGSPAADTDGTSIEWKLDQRSRSEANGKVDERAGSPAFELPAAESRKSSQVDTEIEEIAILDRYAKQGQSRGTYSRSSNKTSASGEKSSEQLLAYSSRGSGKQRGSLLQSNVFERPLGDERSAEACDSERISSRHAAGDTSSGKEAVDRGSGHRTEDAVESVKDISRRRGATGARRISSRGTIMGKSSKDASKLTTRSTVDQSAKRPANPRDLNIAGSEAAKISKARRASKDIARGTVSGEGRKLRTPSPRAEILKSMDLVRRAMRGSSLEDARTPRRMVNDEEREEQIEITRSSCASAMIEIGQTGPVGVSAREGTSSWKNYERTDSVESALRRFDSIETEAGSEPAQGSLGRSEESITWKRGAGRSGDDTKAISLKALDGTGDACRGQENEPSSSGRAWSSGRETPGKGSMIEKMVDGEKKFARARNSIEISRMAVRSESPACKRMLFRDADSEEETGSWRSRCSLDTMAAMERLSTMSDRGKPGDPGNNAWRSFGPGVDVGTPVDAMDKGKVEGSSTGADHSVSVKQLRSIEDIRKSMVGESWDRRAEGTWRKSARRGSSAAEMAEAAPARSEPRRVNIDDRAGNRKEISLPRRSGDVDARKDALGNAARSSVKCAMRFSRVAKSPSPETTKGSETSSRARRNVPASPSKSPDTVARRPSTELKAQDAKSTKRPTPVKSTEPIGNRKTTTTTTTTAATTSTSTRKSTDVVDGAILENGLHLRDQTAETKYDNDSPTTKKSDAFVIDFDEQPPKENDAPLPRKPLFRKQSTEKQIPSTQSARPPSSVSSISSGSSAQGQVSGSRGRMTSRAKTPISGSTSYRGSACGKSGGGAAAVESLVACKVCGRRFAQDRVSLHEQICAKTGQKKRKQFDAMIYRVRGTDIEPFFKKGLVKKQLEKSKKPEVKSNWRRKHEDFINAIRSAKQVQAHLAAGGKLSDLPPPPVSDNCDYIQCPHCGRKFNKAAAERHIPKCEHMLHNKPIHSRAPKPKR